MFVPKYIEVSSPEDLEIVVRKVTHGVRVIGSWIADRLELLAGVVHSVDLRGCEIRDVEALGHLQHTLNLSDNYISDVSPLAGVRKRLNLRNNYIVNTAPLSGVEKTLDLRDNYILEAAHLSHIPGLLLEGNFIPGAPKQKLAFSDSECAIQVVSEL